MYLLVCLSVLLATYLLNTTTITVLYHRGLAHNAVALSPRTRRFAASMGVWLTGLDPKGWVCMHRAHHEFSDTPRDPHSPVHYGIFGVLMGQLRSYERTLVGLVKGKEEYCATVEDLDFDVSWPTRRGLWYLPYVLHVAIALALGALGGWWALGACYFFGMMSHPLEGWIVNSLGHAVGSRNFASDDNSRNNHVAAWLILGEGFQNNHHSFPASARFSFHWWEIDLGYGVCLFLEKAGALEIERALLMPRAKYFIEDLELGSTAG